MFTLIDRCRPDEGGATMVEGAREERFPIGLSMLLMFGISALGWAALVPVAMAFWSVVS